MKINRNEQCPCGSERKYKNCCGIKEDHTTNQSKLIRWLIICFLTMLLGLSTWGIINSFSEDNPQMEAYKCDNPNCNRIHYRPITESN